MNKYKWVCTLIIIAALILVPACQYDETKETESTDSGSVEQVEDSYQAKEVSPQFDENGNPTGEYAQYLWDQQQMEEAMNSLVEDAMREQYEEGYEDHAFPLD